jgi:iron complex transport system ATP-binding protein
LRPTAIELSDVSVTRNGQPILTDVSLAIEAGTCCAVLGPNGAGKSALVAVMSGYLWPSQGAVAVNGQRYGRVCLGDVRRAIGLIEPSRSPPFDGRMAVRDVVATGLFGTIMLPPHRSVSEAQWRRVDAELASVGLDALASRPYGLLSTGEQMKTALARAMVADARILLLDEPTVGLDMGARAACIAALDELLARSDPPTVVIVSHHLDELPRAVQAVALVKAGRLVAHGPPAELLTSANLSELFDCRVTVFRADGRFVASVDGGRQ